MIGIQFDRHIISYYGYEDDMLSLDRLGANSKLTDTIIGNHPELASTVTDSLVHYPRNLCLSAKSCSSDEKHLFNSIPWIKPYIVRNHAHGKN